MKTRSAAVLVALMVLLGALALAPVTAASAATPGGARTWHVLVGGQSADRAVQADGYYPHVITIDAGDTVTWALNTVQLVGVSFAGTCADISSSCAPQDCLTIFREDFQDFSPCGPSRYDGVTGLAQSGMMVSPVYSNWDTSIPHGATTYSLTFTRPGVNIYFDQSVTGMRGVVVVHPAGTRTRSPRRSTPPRRNNSCKPTSRRGPRHAGTPSR